jgi:diguanylate cyclase (GGDEF)-like protein
MDAVPEAVPEFAQSRPGRRGSLRSLVDGSITTILRHTPRCDAIAATRLILEEGEAASLPLISRHPVGSLSGRRRTALEQRGFSCGRLSVVERSATYDRLAASNSALRLAQEALQQQATHDSLTGLLNRGAVVGALETMLTRAKRRQREGAVILLDIDHFKSVNDTHGHLAGDAVLREVGRRLARLTRAGDSVGRYGGEEFLVCLDECTREGAGHVADRLCASIRATPVVIGAVSIDLTVSAGVAQRRRHRRSNRWWATPTRYLRGKTPDVTG